MIKKAFFISALFPIIAFIQCGVTPAARIYYVDAINGDDNNNGLSSDAAWKSIDKVNNVRYGLRSRVLFNRGQTWRGQLVPKNGTTYGAYGTGNKPVLMGSINKSGSSDWIDEGSNIWRCAEVITLDVGNVIFNNAALFGYKKWSGGDLAAQGDFYYDRATGGLRIYSASNPASLYTSIELALRRHVVDYTNVSNGTFENLSITNGGAHGFGGSNTSYITIRQCDISYIGGGDLTLDGQNIRFGNGIEFWGNAHNNLVEGNRIWEIYDSALTNQNDSTVAKQYTITYRNNIIWNCGMSSFEYWNRPARSLTRTIIFENNTAYSAGGGWGGSPLQRPVLNGIHVLLQDNQAATSSIIIRNNIFSEGSVGLWINDASQFTGALVMDYNCWCQTAGTMMYVDGISAYYTMAQFADYQADTGYDSHSVASDPQFINAGSLNFHLHAVSPCINTGTASGASFDFEGTSRPQGGGKDIGAYEQ